MTENIQEQGCCEPTASQGSNQDDCCSDMPEKLLHLADEAWMEVLKDKIKKEIIATDGGKKIDEIAKLVVETNCAKWQNMIAGRKQCEEYSDNLKKIMTSECKK